VTSQITKFLVDGADYFVALTDMPGVRIGLIGSTCYNIPKGHAYYDRVCECASEQDAEEYFDELFGLLG
jgi:hypothetical protein